MRSYKMVVQAIRDGGTAKELHPYDMRTNKHFTLNTKRMTRADLDEFVSCYKSGERQERNATWSEDKSDGRWRSYDYEEIATRDKCSLDLFWLWNESLEDSANPPDPHVLTQEIAEDLQAALEQTHDIFSDFNVGV